jgi:hypothetical protein
MNKLDIQPLANYSFKTTVGGQNCTVTLQQKGDDMYFTLDLPTGNIVSMVRCLNRVKLVRYAYLKFIGDFVFVDLQGNDAPNYAGLGSRWLLLYLTPAEAA